MRSRPTVRLWHGPNVTPGSLVPVTLELTFKTETPVDSVEVRLDEHEFAGYGGGKQRHTATYDGLSLVRTLPGKTYAPGTYRYDFVYEIAVNALPSHKGYDASVRYELFVRVSIPWWPDRTASYALPVDFRAMEPYPPAPQVFTTRDARGSGEPSIELSIDTSDVSVDEIVSGQVSVSDLGKRTCRGIDVAIVQMEHLQRPVTASREAVRWARRIYKGRPPEGETLPFSLRVPRGAQPTFAGHLYGVSAVLEVKCDIALGSDVVLSAPIMLRPPLASPRQLGTELISPVGNGRLDRVFTVVAGRLGLEHDQHRRSLRGKAGALAVTVGLDHRQDGYHRTARFDWPALGVGLIVEPKGTGNLFGLAARTGAEIPGYVVTARDPEQVAALVMGLARRVGLYDHMYCADSGVELSQKGDASTVQALSTFTLGALNFANELSDVLAALPAPLGMERFVPAWQAYAEQVGGAFSRTAMRIDGGRAGFDALTVETHYAVHGVPTDTTFTLALDPPLDLGPAGLDLASANLSAQARSLAVALTAEHHAEIAPAHLSVSVPGAVPDPAAHVPLVDRLAALAAALRGQVAQIPYR